MAHRQGETLPQELQIFAEQMQVGFSPAAVIHSNLLALAAKLKLPITWTRHFITTGGRLKISIFDPDGSSLEK